MTLYSDCDGRRNVYTPPRLLKTDECTLDENISAWQRVPNGNSEEEWWEVDK